MVGTTHRKRGGGGWFQRKTIPAIDCIRDDSSTLKLPMCKQATEWLFTTASNFAWVVNCILAERKRNIHHTSWQIPQRYAPLHTSKVQVGSYIIIDHGAAPWHASSNNCCLFIRRSSWFEVLLMPNWITRSRKFAAVSTTCILWLECDVANLCDARRQIH